MSYLVNRYIEKLGISVGKAVGVLGARISRVANPTLRAEIKRDLRSGMKNISNREILGTNWTRVAPSAKGFRSGVFNFLDDLKKTTKRNLSEKDLYGMVSKRIPKSLQKSVAANWIL